MRVLLFGIDGLTFHILNPLIDRGFLPNFQRVRDGGVQGILKSTIPPVAPQAWMSLCTGLPPAGHGVYGCWEHERTEQHSSMRIITRRKGGKALWNIFSDWGKRVIVANVPFTYPTEPVNGIMLSRCMVPERRAVMTYPPGFKEEMKCAVSDSQIRLPAVQHQSLGSEEVLEAAMKRARGQMAMFRHLLNKSWDFCFLVCDGIMQVQQVCWEEIMAFSPRAVAYYQLLDTMLGMMLGALRASDLLLLVSNHGCCVAHRSFSVHEYLYRRGLLSLKESQSRWLRSMPRVLRILGKRCSLQRVVEFLSRHLQRFGLPVEKKQGFPDLDWRKTDAWIPALSTAPLGYADIFLDNTLSEEAIKNLVTDLQNICDPETGEPLFVEMHRENIYGRGAFAPAERHLIVLANDHTALLTELGCKNLWRNCTHPLGMAHSDGVLYFYGCDVKQGIHLAPAYIYDIAPTILSYMELPLPCEMKGSILQDAFSRNITPLPAGGEARMRLKKFAWHATPLPVTRFQ